MGIPDARRRLRSYPYEMSGGRNQWVMIAAALAGQPELLVADEPTTALNVTIQAGILDLLRRLRAETGMAMVLISHDLGVVAETCGIQPPMTSLGNMIGYGREYLTRAPWILLAPSAVVVLTMFGVSVLGDWLRDRLDPTLD